MRETNDMWLATNFRLRRADDFQALELFALTEVHRTFCHTVTIDLLSASGPDAEGRVEHGCSRGLAKLAHAEAHNVNSST